MYPVSAMAGGRELAIFVTTRPAAEAEADGGSGRMALCRSAGQIAAALVNDPVYMSRKNRKFLTDKFDT